MSRLEQIFKEIEENKKKEVKGSKKNSENNINRRKKTMEAIDKYKQLEDHIKKNIKLDERIIILETLIDEIKKINEYANK